MKNVLILLPNDVMGGAEQYLFELAKYNSQNYNLKVVFLKQPISFYWKNNLKEVEQVYLNATSEKVGILKLIIWLVKNRINYKYVLTSHVHTNGMIGFFRKIKLISSNFHIARESTFIFDRFRGLKLAEFKLFYKMGYSKIDLLITQSELMKSKLLNSLSSNTKPKKTKTIPNLIDVKTIISKSNTNIPSEKDYIITAGRLIPEKGYDILIKAFNSIKTKTNKTLLILGEGNDRILLEELIKKNSLTDRVKLLGFKNNPMPYFKHASLCVVSSRVEGFPNVLLQMMALNGNVISTLCAGGIEELEGINTCKANDEAELTKLLLNSLNNPQNNIDIFKKEMTKRSVESYWNQIEIFIHKKE